MLRVLTPAVLSILCTACLSNTSMLVNLSPMTKHAVYILYLRTPGYQNAPSPDPCCSLHSMYMPQSMLVNLSPMTKHAAQCLTPPHLHQKGLHTGEVGPIYLLEEVV